MGLLGQRPRTVLLTAIAVAEDQPRFPQGQVTRPHRDPVCMWESTFYNERE